MKNGDQYQFRYFYPSENTKLHHSVLIGTIQSIRKTILSKVNFDEEILKQGPLNENSNFLFVSIANIEFLVQQTL